jgi:hypothetical protein
MPSIRVFPSPVILAFTLMLAFTACDRRAEGERVEPAPQEVASEPTQAPSDEPSRDDTASVAGTTTPQPAAAQLSAGDQAFLEQASRVNEDDIAATTVGIERASPNLQELSRQLNGDQIALRDRIRELTPEMEPSTGKAPPDLAGLQGEELDARLLAHYRTRQQQAIATFETASQDRALAEPVRNLALETLPSLRAHLTSVNAAQASE